MPVYVYQHYLSSSFIVVDVDFEDCDHCCWSTKSVVKSIYVIHLAILADIISRDAACSIAFSTSTTLQDKI